MKALQNEEPRSRLGRGLAALIGDSGNETDAVVRARGQKRVPIEFLRANPRNPRTVFDEPDLQELTDSIREKGIIQPILVRTVPGVADAYEIIAGERRFRAAGLAGLDEVPVLVKDVPDESAAAMALIENVQRANLNAIEEAQGYERLATDFGYSQVDLAKVIGKSRPHVVNTLRLLKLPDATREFLSSGLITAGHARALLGSSQADVLAARIVAKGLSVREIERLVQVEKDQAATPDAPPRAKATKDADTRALEKRIADRIGLAIDIKHKGDAGEVRLRYTSLDQLDKVVALLSA